MNLADRSVGQIDAALRRRFAFVSFSPNDDQTGGLLGRWLAKDNQNPWPADLVDAVNVELELDLGHTDLLIGPSYFMKKKLDMEKMGRIWRYSIEPVTADLFHGDNNLTKKYRWSSVAARHKAIVPTTQSDSSATAAVVALSNEQAPASAATSTTPSANAADDIAN